MRVVVFSNAYDYYVCIWDGCSYECVTRCQKRYHMNIQLDNKEFMCTHTGCVARFYSPGSRNKHLKKCKNANKSGDWNSEKFKIKLFICRRIDYKFICHPERSRGGTTSRLHL